jgi:copper transport protein
VVATVGLAIAPASASAHAGLVGSDPSAGARLGAAPDSVRLTFSEQPEPSLSEIRVLGAGAAAEQSIRPRTAAGDPSTVEVPVGRLGRGVYTVSWKVFSAVDGHASGGTLAFGVRASPTGVAASAAASESRSSRFELLARWILLLGALALIGAAVAGVARFGGSSGSDLGLAAAGWALAAVGLLLLAESQRITAASSFGELLDTTIGAALVWRAAALAASGLALLFACRRPRARRAALAAAALAALGLIVAHVEAGHAGAGGWPVALAVSAQAVHFAAAGIWFGGLAALLLGFRSASAAAREAAVRRFAGLALGALLVVAASGVLRAVDELAAWNDLFASGYGRALLVKVALLTAIVAIAARHRPWKEPAGAGDLGALQRRSRLELGLALAAIAVAALLGTLAPPGSGGVEQPGLSVAGEDFGRTTRVELTTASDEPGPNRFTVAVEDRDSGEPVAADGVSLRFTPLDDPGVPPSSLRLERAPGEAFVGAGANLPFDGRWAVDVLVERGGDAVEIPLELVLPVPEQFVSVLDIPGSPRPPEYTMQTENGYIRIAPDPERPGPGQIHISTYSPFEALVPSDRLVVTTAVPGQPPRQLPVRRLGPSRFVAAAELERGELEIGVVARTRGGVRLRGVFKLQIPS